MSSRVRVSSCLWLGVALVVLMAAAGCNGLTIKPGVLACGAHGECPSPLQCIDKRCWDKGHNDAAVDMAAVDAADGPAKGLDGHADVASDMGSPFDAGLPPVPTCSLGQHLCPVGCVMDTSPQTCGTSCSPCMDPANGGTATCEAAQCSGVCPMGKKLCAGSCVDSAAACSGGCPADTHVCGKSCPATSDVNACGTSCAPCPVPANAVEATCDGTTCGFTCKNGYHPCGQTCAADADPGACGGTCAVCPSDPNGHPMCSGNACGLQCNMGYHVCGTKCVSNSDVGSCGASSCMACPNITGGTATCDGTVCGGACPALMKVCNGACVPTAQACGACPAATHNCSNVCVDSASTNSCGTLCGACPKPTGASQTTCTAGVCDFTCGQGYHRCAAASTCAANDDASACGTACTVCPTDPNGVASCQSNGTCALSCNLGYHPCGTKCVSNKDLNNCGATACGTACSAPTGGTVSCDGISCVPVCTNTNQYICQGTCIDKTLPCGGVCPVAGQRVCSGFCRANDVNTCGPGPTCQTCPAPTANGSAACNGTACSIVCNQSFKNCAGTNLCISSSLPACCTSAECTAAPTGTVGVCSGNTCTYPCNAPTYKACNGACIPTASCCTSGDCPSNKPICSAGTCVGKPNGQSCTAGTGECATGNCVDGYCCDGACGGQCQACDVSGFAGTCKPVPAGGAPHHAAQPARQGCGGDAACAGTCNGTSTTACVYPANQCRVNSCSNGVQINAAVCNASGICPGVTTTTCQFACAATGVCGGTCTPGTTRCGGVNVDTPQTCDGFGNWQGATACSGTTPKCDVNSHVCVKAPLGAACPQGTSQCVNGATCVGGVCCESACGGLCDKGNACDSGGHCAHKDVGTACKVVTGSNPGYNDFQLFCDNNGSCIGPTFMCGNSGQSCASDGNTACCARPGGQIDIFKTCGAASTCNGNYGENCLSTRDCPNGNVCCFSGGFGFGWAVCAPTCDAGRQVCDPNRPIQCPSGTSCQLYNGLESTCQ